MDLYFVNYDLRNQRDYQKLYDELDRFSAVKILESLYCFKRNNTTASNLRDHFKRFIDSDDGLYVTQVSSWASWNTDNSPNDL